MTAQKSPSQHRRDKERDRRRSQILQAAKTRFLSQGYDNTKLKQIADDAGFVRATIYNYFRNGKMDLYLAVATEAFQALCELLETNLPQVLQSGLIVLISGYLQLARDNPAYAELIDDIRLREALSQIIRKEANQEPLTEDEKQFRTFQSKSFNLLVQGITTMITQTENAIDHPPMAVASALSAIVPGWIKELIRREKTGTQSPEESDHQIQLVIQLIENGRKL